LHALSQQAAIKGLRSKTSYGSRPGGHAGKPSDVSPNLLQRQFNVLQPNMVWVTDITYLHTHEGWLFLAVIMNLFSRQVIGCSMCERMTSDLALSALPMAVWRRKPKGEVMVHSHKGSQGEVNRSSQHWVVDWILDIHLRFHRVSSSQVFFGAWCSAHWPRRGSPGRSIGTGRYP